MSPLIAILALLLLAVVALVVGAPLRRSRALASAAPDAHELTRSAAASAHQSRRDELDAAREAKYHEIRDCELDYRTGKLSLEDYEATDAQLRAEALEILDRLEASEPR